MFVIIDKEDCPFDTIVDFLNKEGISSRIIKGVQAARDYIGTHPLENTHFLIHGSLGKTRVRFEQEGYGTDVKQIVESIHDRNILARITIRSGVDVHPIKETITDLGADGYIWGTTGLEDLIQLAKMGEVTAEELQERGKTIENIRDGERTDGEPRRFKFSKEREE